MFLVLGGASESEDSCALSVLQLKVNVTANANDTQVPAGDGEDAWLNSKSLGAGDVVDSLASSVLEKSGQPTPIRSSGIVLHMHFNMPEFAKNAMWFLEETRLCHPDNFIACLFVSDWKRDGREGPPVLSATKHGARTQFMDCSANQPVVVSTGVAWPAFHVQQCLAQTLQWASRMDGAVGVLFLADDTVVTRPWAALSADLQSHGGIVLPDIQFADCDLPTCKKWPDINLLNTSSWPEHSSDQWFWDVTADGAGSGPSRLLGVMQNLRPGEKQGLGMTHSLIPVFKSHMDAIYVPLSRAAQFQRLSHVFYEAGIYHEYAAKNIVRAIEGPHASLGPQEALMMESLWNSDRMEDPFPFIDDRTAFLHPVKIGGQGEAFNKNRNKLKSLYDVVFGKPDPKSLLQGNELVESMKKIDREETAGPVAVESTKKIDVENGTKPAPVAVRPGLVAAKAKHLGVVSSPLHVTALVVLFMVGFFCLQCVPSSSGSASELRYNVFSFMLSNACLLFLNKLLATSISAPAFIIACQCGCSAVSLRMGHIMGRTKLDTDMDIKDILRFSVVPLSMVITLYANLKLISFVNLETFVILRASTPLIQSWIDFTLLQREMISFRSAMVLAAIFVLLVMHLYLDASWEINCWAWTGIWYLATISDNTFIKYYMNLNPMNTATRTYYTNVVIAIVAAATSAKFEDVQQTIHMLWVPRHHFFEIVTLMASCLFGLTISFYGFAVREAVAATTFDLIGLTCKLLSVALSMLLLTQHASYTGASLAVTGLILSLLYQEAPLRSAPKEISCIQAAPGSVESRPEEDGAVTPASGSP